jgi:lipid-binding SYLF domain-containing protein
MAGAAQQRDAPGGARQCAAKGEQPMRALTKMLVAAALAAAYATMAPPALAADEQLGVEAKQAAREVRLKLASDGLEKLYQLQPEAKTAVEGAVGYAVFEVDSIYAILFVGQQGKGVLYDTALKKHTFMLSKRIGTGPGAGKQTVYQIFVFKTKQALDQFVSAGNAGGDVGASASTGTGGIMRSFNPSIDIYQVPISGMAVQASWGGTVYTVDSQLK